MVPKLLRRFRIVIAGMLAPFWHAEVPEDFWLETGGVIRQVRRCEACEINRGARWRAQRPSGTATAMPATKSPERR